MDGLISLAINNKSSDLGFRSLRSLSSLLRWYKLQTPSPVWWTPQCCTRVYMAITSKWLSLARHTSSLICSFALQSRCGGKNFFPSPVVWSILNPVSCGVFCLHSHSTGILQTCLFFSTFLAKDEHFLLWSFYNRANIYESERGESIEFQMFWISKRICCCCCCYVCEKAANFTTEVSLPFCPRRHMHESTSQMAPDNYLHFFIYYTTHLMYIVRVCVCVAAACNLL